MLSDIFPPEYVTWPAAQREQLTEWEAGFQKFMGVNWTSVPQLKQTTGPMISTKQRVPTRPLAPVSLQHLKVLEF
jgi:hypothetical protein